MERKGLVLEEHGSWEDVVWFAERIAAALADRDVMPEEAVAFEAWIPGPGDDEKVVEERTVENETLAETGVEAASDGARRELRRAGGAMEQGGSDLVHGHPRETVRDMGEAGRSTARGILPAIIRGFRRIERLLYRVVVGRTNPEYFEGQRVTASLSHGLLRRNRYTLRVQFRSRDVAETVAEAVDDG